MLFPHLLQYLFLYASYINRVVAGYAGYIPFQLGFFLFNLIMIWFIGRLVRRG